MTNSAEFSQYVWVTCPIKGCVMSYVRVKAVGTIMLEDSGEFVLNARIDRSRYDLHLEKNHAERHAGPDDGYGDRSADLLPDREL